MLLLNFYLVLQISTTKREKKKEIKKEKKERENENPKIDS